MPAHPPESTADPALEAPSDAGDEAPIERLRTGIEQAARLIGRLRRENGRVRARVEEIEAHPGLAKDGTTLALDDDAEVLRRRIEGYIDAIDRQLADAHAQE